MEKKCVYIYKSFKIYSVNFKEILFPLKIKLEVLFKIKTRSMVL